MYIHLRIYTCIIIHMYIYIYGVHCVGPYDTGNILGRTATLRRCEYFLMNGNHKHAGSGSCLWEGFKKLTSRKKQKKRTCSPISMSNTNQKGKEKKYIQGSFYYQPTQFGLVFHVHFFTMIGRSPAFHVGKQPKQPCTLSYSFWYLCFRKCEQTT